MRHSEWLEYCAENGDLITETNVIMPHDDEKRKLIEFRLDGRLKRFVLEED